MVAFACIFRAEANLWAGSLADAEADALEATEAFTRAGDRALEPVSMLVQVQVERDRPDEAEKWLERVTPPELPALWDAAVLLCARARLRLVQGRAAEATRDALDAGGILAPYATRGVHVAPALIPWRSTAAIALAAQERLEEARELASEEVDLARRLGAPRAIGVALQAVSLAETGERRLRRRPRVGDGARSLACPPGTRPSDVWFRDGAAAGPAPRGSPWAPEGGA